MKNAFYFIEKAHFVLESISYCFRGWSKIYLKVYDIINCRNNNSIAHFVSYLEKEIRYDIESFSIDRVLNKEYFYEKSYWECASKAIPRPLFKFGK